MSGKDEYTIKGAKKKNRQNTWGSKNSSTTGHNVMHQSERDWCNNSQARLLHSISFHVGRVSEWGVNWGSRWTCRCTGRSRATSLVLSVWLSLSFSLPFPTSPCCLLLFTDLAENQARTCPSIWLSKPENLTPSGENKAGMLADKQH